MSAAPSTPFAASPLDPATLATSDEAQQRSSHVSETPSGYTSRPSNSPTTVAGSVDGDANDVEKAEHAAEERAKSPQGSIKQGAKGGAVDGKDPNLVLWDDSNGPDPANPQKWPKAKKWAVIFVVSTCSLCVTCNSSIVSATFTSISQDFGFGHEVAVLGLSLFVMGLGLGPLFLGPFSEAYGRRPIYIAAFSAFFLLQFPVAFANNAAVYFIFRFLVGLAGSAFLSVAGGTVVDLFNPYELFPPMAAYTASPFFGPVMGPLIGDYIVEYTDGKWRWVWWTTIIWSFVQLTFIVFLTPETFGPKILTKRARQLRKETGNENLYSAHEQVQRQKSFAQTLKTTLARVPLLLIYEPMLLLLCIWSALLLGILYLLFEAFPIVFQDQHGFTQGQTGLAFIGIAVGIIIGLLTIPFWQRLYQKAADKNGGQAPPEERLPMCMVGGFCTVIGLFGFAFTSYPHVHWIAPIIFAVPFGLGTIYIYTAIFSYTGSTWSAVAASALGANSLVRSAFAAAFPLFANQMYDRMGTDGATAFLGGLNVLMIPIPFVLYKYGARIRAKSRFTH